LVPAVAALAARQGLPYAGSDGKTGETLVKSVLAPLFRYRNLRVLSWMGYNLLGNRDGQILDHPAHKESKVRTKDSILSGILGYRPQTRVGIDYVPSLHDSKVAWDFIHFAGFLDWPMTLSFTWHGCDSILAAPLVLDLVRFMDEALRRSSGGPQEHLGCFFKAPVAGPIRLGLTNLAGDGQADLNEEWYTGFAQRNTQLRANHPTFALDNHIYIANGLRGLDRKHVPPLHLAKGHYFALAGRTPFTHLVYPMPDAASLGVHVTLDLNGRAKFGPDVEWIERIDYDVDAGRAASFYAAIRSYYPGLPDGALEPAYTGIRPKLQAPGGPAEDFVIQGAETHGVRGLVNLFGIESPGLTSSLAIADEVAARLL